jgi:hypothetical protein
VCVSFFRPCLYLSINQLLFFGMVCATLVLLQGAAASRAHPFPDIAMRWIDLTIYDRLYTLLSPIFSLQFHDGDEDTYTCEKHTTTTTTTTTTTNTTIQMFLGTFPSAILHVACLSDEEINETLI